MCGEEAVGKVIFLAVVVVVSVVMGIVVVRLQAEGTKRALVIVMVVVEG